MISYTLVQNWNFCCLLKMGFRKQRCQLNCLSNNGSQRKCPWTLYLVWSLQHPRHCRCSHFLLARIVSILLKYWNYSAPLNKTLVSLPCSWKMAFDAAEKRECRILKPIGLELFPTFCFWEIHLPSVGQISYLDQELFAFSLLNLQSWDCSKQPTAAVVCLGKSFLCFPEHSLSFVLHEAGNPLKQPMDPDSQCWCYKNKSFPS